LLKAPLGRVAAGAIAEKYLKTVYGIEVIAFVSSVGRVHLPSSVTGQEDDTEAQDILTPEFRALLASVTREEVDKHPTRCPHRETAELMTKVRISVVRVLLELKKILAHSSSKRSPRLHRRHNYLCHP
jgi:chorismate synthase